MKNPEPIVCKLRSIPSSIEQGLKSGRYSGSFDWGVKGLLDNSWIVLAYLDDVDWVSLKLDYKTEEDIIQGCLQYLNMVPEKKKGAKKQPKPKFGNLKMFKSKFATKDGIPYIIAEFITDERTNPNFWGSGQSWDGKKISKKRGRPAKIVAELQPASE